MAETTVPTPGRVGDVLHPADDLHGPGLSRSLKTRSIRPELARIARRAAAVAVLG